LLDPGSEATRSVLQRLNFDLDRALGENPFAHELRALHAVSRALTGDATRTENEADELLKSAPDAAETYVLRGVIHLRHRRYGPAEEDLAAARRLDDALDFDLFGAWLRVLRSASDEWGEAIGVEELAQLRAFANERCGEPDEPPNWHDPLALLVRAQLA